MNKLIKKLQKAFVIPCVSPCLCSLKGHDWSDGEAKQICLRNGCNATRILMWNRHPKIDEPALRWHYYNIDDLNFK